MVVGVLLVLVVVGGGWWWLVFWLVFWLVGLVVGSGVSTLHSGSCELSCIVWLVRRCSKARRSPSKLRRSSCWSPLFFSRILLQMLVSHHQKRTNGFVDRPCHDTCSHTSYTYVPEHSVDERMQASNVLERTTDCPILTKVNGSNRFCTKRRPPTPLNFQYCDHCHRHCQHLWRHCPRLFRHPPLRPLEYKLDSWTC